MKLKLTNNQMEEIEGLHPEYPYTLHHVDLSQTPIPWHWHEEVEFDYVCEGSMEICTPTKTYTFQKGSACFINTNVLCTFRCTDHCVIDSHLFHPTFLSGHFRSVFETKYLNPVLQNRKIEILQFCEDTKDQKTILQKLRQAAALQQNPDVEFQTRNLFSEIWLCVMEEIRRSEENTAPLTTINQDRLLTMLSFIHEHYQEHLSLREIAASVSISERECLRCFQNLIHETPFSYLLTYRIEMAKKLLQNSQFSVLEIALQTGFSNSAYFGKQFKRLSGQTPGTYRKTSRQL